MGFFAIIPLMIIPIMIYNVIAWSGATFASSEAVLERMDAEFLSVPMASGAQWVVTPGHALIALSLAMLFFELLKSTDTGRAAVMNHAFSMVLFIVSLVEFLMFPAFATSVFFLIMLMALMDVMAGFMVTIASARRDINVSEGYGD
ncbi:MAG TPA: hypothetical protein ENJ46_06230 [Hellea balneolensis]|uniref:Uncharacterized protein n=1 Tax=Hellea balneolensis TaxID=287478 RepID=A0A7C3CA38_9PROT|nr:hypothetical protein [Hellea balneolensis]